MTPRARHSSGGALGEGMVQCARLSENQRETLVGAAHAWRCSLQAAASPLLPIPAPLSPPADPYPSTPPKSLTRRANTQARIVPHAFLSRRHARSPNPPSRLGERIHALGIEELPLGREHGSRGAAVGAAE